MNTKTYFNGDIIITDPCYLFDDEDIGDDDVCWDEFICEMQKCNKITAYMERDTAYGDWFCTTFDSDTEEKIGTFCADAGMVCVAYIDEINAIRKKKFEDCNNYWSYTVIENFRGKVRFVTRKGNALYVIGRGINSVTGESINFITIQTGF